MRPGSQPAPGRRDPGGDQGCPRCALLERRLELLAARVAMLETARSRPAAADLGLVRTIATSVGPNVAFSSHELWAHRAVSPALRQAFEDTGITSTRRLGKRLERLHRCQTDLFGMRLERIGHTNTGVLWTVTVPADYHHGASLPRGPGA